ncbi:MAG TPA: aminotransferase class V-fold PLP-dependent enzyme [Propionibacteriaceae bacterium]|nr:aminotransferase class V-fold PLP-dependent enzyme [Propionibacteriaceae bacterium]
MADERKILERVLEEATGFLDGLPGRRVAARTDVDGVAEALRRPLPDEGAEPMEVIEELIAGAEPGVLAIPSGRFFGWVMGGVLPVTLAADWLTSTWDQNAGLLVSSPAAAGAEWVASEWLLDLLGLPGNSAVGFVTGAMIANFTCLAAARHDVLRRAGWDVEGDGLHGAPPVTVIVGQERHETVDVALRFLGLGEQRTLTVPADDQGRIRLDALTDILAQVGNTPLIVCLQAGNVHSGAFDPIAEAVDLAHQYGAWVHVDGAFGLWAAASAQYRHLVAGVERADSWASDAHKTLNVPYDSGLAIVAKAEAMYAAMGVHAAYLIQDERPDPFSTVPEFSRRARGFTVWAALRSLGRRGVAEMVERFCRHARRFDAGLAELDGVRVVNDVVFTQVCVSFGTDEATREVATRLLRDGTAWMTPSTWHGQAVLRISVSNWRTTEEDVDRTLAAVRRVLAEVRAG